MKIHSTVPSMISSSLLLVLLLGNLNDGTVLASIQNRGVVSTRRDSGAVSRIRPCFIHQRQRQQSLNTNPGIASTPKIRNPEIGEFQTHRRSALFMEAESDSNDEDEYSSEDESSSDEEEIDFVPPPAESFKEDDFGASSRIELESLTVPQLKQQLRLRGLKVSGLKAELVSRLISGGKSDILKAVQDGRLEKPKGFDSTFADDMDKKVVDVTAYMEEEEPEEASESVDNEEMEGAEVWGEEAKVVTEYEDGPVVDNLSRAVIEFKGAYKTQIKAYVVASRDSLKGWLRGGIRSKRYEKSPQEKVKELQQQKETAAKVPMRPGEEIQGVDDPEDKTRMYDKIERDYSDWGVYTTTGAQISAQEVQGILFLSDVRGPYSPDTKALCEKIAFECQPCVVMAPDLFRDHPWEELPSSPGFNKQEEDYEEWRANHADNRVSVDIRAAAAVLRERYAVSSIAVFGTCYGGGRALEAAAGWIPNNSIGPPPVNPSACISWYPTRYHAPSLFGKESSAKWLEHDNTRKVAIMAIFAQEDTLQGATPHDAKELKDMLQHDTRVKDCMVKVFSNQKHGFAHVGIGSEDGAVGGGDAEVAALLSTAWMETYTRMFLPTVGDPVKNDVNGWADLEMKDTMKDTERDMRKEIDQAVADYDPNFDEFDLDYSNVTSKIW